MRCRHENADHLKAGMWFIDMDGEPISDVLCEQFRCMDCHAWLSLGPATPPPRRELQLAEWIADLCRLWEPGKEREARIRDAVDVAVFQWGEQ